MSKVTITTTSGKQYIVENMDLKTMGDRINTSIHHKTLLSVNRTLVGIQRIVPILVNPLLIESVH